MTNIEAEPVSGSALSSMVYERLRTAIIECRYPAGERLRERDVASELEVSRVPIREALPRLEAAGFVRMEARRGAVVTFITNKTVEELYDVRAVIEPLVASTAAHRAAAGEPTASLSQALDSAQRAFDLNDAHELDTANAQLHREILLLSGSELLHSTLAPLTERNARLNGVTIDTDPDQRHVEHRMLVQAVIAGDAEVAKSIAFAHVELGRKRTLAALPHHPHYAPPAAPSVRRRGKTTS